MSSTQEAGEIFGEGRGPAHAMLRSPTVLIASVGLWGMNVFFFKLFRINYVKVLRADLLKLEEFDHQQLHGHHHKETSSMDKYREEDDSSVGADDNINARPPLPQSSSSSSRRPSSPSQSQLQQQTLIQRAPSAGVPLIAQIAATNAAAGGSTSASPHSMSGEEDEEEIFEDEEQQQLVTSSGDHASDQDASITWGRLVGLSMLLLGLLHSTYFMWLDVLQGGTIGAVLMFYTLVLLAITVPFRCTRWLRKATVITLQRTYELINPRCHCVTNDGVTPPRFIPFVDVFYADAMCSLSKVFFDWGMLLHMVSHYPNPVPASAHNILIPSACAAIPYLIRARQCLIMYRVGVLQNERNRYSHLWNALKYSTSIFPLILSAYQQTIPKRAAHNLEGLLISLLVINSVYALYWDIVMDWGMMQDNPIGMAMCNTGSKKKSKSAMSNPHKALSNKSNWIHTILRPKLRFGLAMSALILVIDCVLRFGWMLRFSKTVIFPNADSFVLCTQFLEVFRRALWNLLRVEWENIKHSKNKVTSPTNTDKPPAAANLGAADLELKSFLSSSGKLNTL